MKTSAYPWSPQDAESTHAPQLSAFGLIFATQASVSVFIVSVPSNNVFVVSVINLPNTVPKAAKFEVLFVHLV